MAEKLRCDLKAGATPGDAALARPGLRPEARGRLAGLSIMGVRQRRGRSQGGERPGCSMDPLEVGRSYSWGPAAKKFWKGERRSKGESGGIGIMNFTRTGINISESCKFLAGLAWKRNENRV